MIDIKYNKVSVHIRGLFGLYMIYKSSYSVRPIAVEINTFSNNNDTYVIVPYVLIDKFNFIRDITLRYMFNDTL